MPIIKSPYQGIELPRPDTIFRHYLPAEARFPEYPAFIDGLTGRSISSTQLRTNALRLGLGIRNLLQGNEQQVGQKQVALIFSPNSIDFPQIFYGCQSVKFITSLANASYTFKEIAHQIRDGRPKISFVHPTLYSTYKQAEDILKTEGHALPTVFWAVPGSATSGLERRGCQSYENLMVDMAEIRGFEGTEAEGDEAYDTALLCYSSGTVSRYCRRLMLVLIAVVDWSSKGFVFSVSEEREAETVPIGVMTTHQNVNANGVISKPCYPSDMTYGVDSKILGCLPLFHIYGILE